MDNFFHDQEAEHYASQPDSIAAWDRFDAELGAYNNNDTREWILSDRDVWYRNPFFTGTLSGRHPEDYDSHDEAEAAAEGFRFEQPASAPQVEDTEDECPF